MTPMPPYRARTSGIFGSNVHDIGRPQIDYGQLVDSLTTGASSLIRQAMAQKLQRQQFAREDDDRQYQRTRDRQQDERADRDFKHKARIDDAKLLSEGYHEGKHSVPTGMIARAMTGNPLYAGPETAETPAVPHFDLDKNLQYRVATDRARISAEARNEAAAARSERPRRSYDAERGAVVDLDAGTATPVKGISARPQDPVARERLRTTMADRYVEAAGGDYQKALKAAVDDPSAQDLFDGKGMHSSHIQAAATRFKEERERRKKETEKRTLEDIRRDAGVRGDTPTSPRLTPPRSAAASDSTAALAAKAAWAKANPVKRGETREQYHARYEASKGSR